MAFLSYIQSSSNIFNRTWSNVYSQISFTIGSGHSVAFRIFIPSYMPDCPSYRSGTRFGSTHRNRFGSFTHLEFRVCECLERPRTLLGAERTSGRVFFATETSQIQDYQSTKYVLSMCVCVCVYIYIYICNPLEVELLKKLIICKLICNVPNKIENDKSTQPNIKFDKYNLLYKKCIVLVI